MRIRSLVAVATLATVSLTACGGGKSNTKSDFINEMAQICQDTKLDLEAIDEPKNIADLEGTSGDAIEVLTDTAERLDELTPPEDLADNFKDFKNNVDDQLDALEDLQKAGKDRDEAAANDVSAELGELSTRRSELGSSLGVAQCVNEPESTDSTDLATTDSGLGDSGLGTVPVTVVPLTLPATLPPQTLPPETLPPETIPPATLPPETAAPTAPLFEIIDLTTMFNAPEGFTLVNADPTAAQDFINIVAGVPELNTGLQQMGVSVLLQSDGTAVATIVLGVSIGDAMPSQWKDILCGTDGVLRTSGNGYTGIFCPGPPGSGVPEIFTMTQGDLGLSVATLIESAPADLVVDAFFEANS